MRHSMDALVGKTVTALRVLNDESCLVVETTSGPLVFCVAGDCCSESWFADITGALNLIGGTVQTVEQAALPDYNCDDGRGRQEVDEVYGYRIATTKGHCVIAFRNSSNGYYGGWLSEVTEAPDGVWREITSDDWHA